MFSTQISLTVISLFLILYTFRIPRAFGRYGALLPYSLPASAAQHVSDVLTGFQRATRMCVTQHVLMIRKVHPHTESLMDSLQSLQNQTIHVENFTSVVKVTKAKQSMSSVLTNEGNVLLVYHYRNLCMLINK